MHAKREKKKKKKKKSGLRDALYSDGPISGNPLMKRLALQEKLRKRQQCLPLQLQEITTQMFVSN